jgi:O-6-methylguanine DNA methyltransferase
MSPFTTRVLSVVRRIPVGRVATYGDVAKAAGRPRAARAVGTIMRKCGRQDVPCHRVVAAAGRLGGFGGNLELKRALLRAEGLHVTGSTIRNFSLRRWPVRLARPSAHSGQAPALAQPSARSKPARRRPGKHKGPKLR